LSVSTLRLFILFFGCLLVTGCSFFPEYGPEHTVSDPRLAATLYWGAQIKPAAAAAIARANHSIGLEMYECCDAGLTHELILAARRGVQVRVLLDATEKHSKVAFQELATAGIRVKQSEIPGGINHIKLLVVDKQIVLTGGMNWGPESWYNHDLDIEFRHAPSAFDELFAADFEGTVDRRREERSSPLVHDDQIKPELLSLIQSARKTVDVEIFSFSDRDVVRALAQDAERGVKVRVVLDPRQTVNRTTAALLAAQGVRIRFFDAHHNLLHAKVCAVDDHNVLLGSANFTYHGFAVNHELDVVFSSAAIGEAISRDVDAQFR
jgi:cardiolipin synthase